MAAETKVRTERKGSRKKKSNPLFFMIILGLIIAMAGGGFFAYTKFRAPHPIKDAAKDKPPQPAKIIGEVLSLEPFIVNLSDPKGRRYLKVQIQLEMESKEAVARATEATPKLRDMVIMMLTSLTFEDVMTPEGKIRIRDELLQRFNQILRPDRVANIYFTQFVVQ
ncbi:MAG: flagellar basal body-associated FliL family protein [Deltaproteobacteria bacterium]|jgi:flagellar FliL protein